MTYVTVGKREMSDHPVATSRFPLCPDQSVGLKEVYENCASEANDRTHDFFFLSQINNILNKNTEMC